MPARAFVFVELDPAEGERFERTFAEVAEHFRTVPGMQANILLRDTANPGSYIVVSEWDSRESFLAWEEEPSHRELTKPLQEFWSGAGTARHLYEVAVTTDAPS